MTDFILRTHPISTKGPHPFSGGPLRFLSETTNDATLANWRGIQVEIGTIVVTPTLVIQIMSAPFIRRREEDITPPVCPVGPERAGKKPEWKPCNAGIPRQTQSALPSLRDAQV
jgi:hypothetical protein